MSRFAAYTGPKPDMYYTDASDLWVLHSLPMSDGYSVKVVGNPDMGSYEWMVECGGKIEHSDCGYGDSDIALRDGLIVMHGYPQEVIKRKSIEERRRFVL